MKYEKEITVEIDVKLDELKSILKTLGFKIIEEYDLNDIYMINKNDRSYNNYSELLKRCILIRNVIEDEKNIKILTYKYKEYNNNKDIIKQGKINCYIDSIENAQKLFEALNFEKLITINDHMLVYSNGIDEFTVQDVNNKHIYLEIEDKCSHIGKCYKTIDEMKNIIKKYNIPIKEENYFVKKAEIELEEILQ